LIGSESNNTQTKPEKEKSMTGNMIITEIGNIRNNVDRLLTFVAERETIRIKRAENSPWPWTTDPILQTYSFCNVRREDDKTTKWIARNFREPHAGEPDLWFATVVARLVNLIGTLAALGFPVPWDPNWFLDVMAARGKERYGHFFNSIGPKRPTLQRKRMSAFG
jgi:hypothetical protein